MKEELVQHIQNLLVSQIKGQTGPPPPPPPPPAPVEDEEKENNQILGHINNNVNIYTVQVQAVHGCGGSTACIVWA